ncbi:MAG: choice-of-anchor I family protein [Planctomycetota bacterium]
MRLLLVSLATIAISLLPQTAKANNIFDILWGKPTLQVEWTYSTGVFDESAAEIVAYDSATHRIFVTNGNDQAVDVLDVEGNKIGAIDVSGIGSPDSTPTSVASFNGLIAIAVDPDDTAVRGNVLFVDASSLSVKSTVEVGFLPDMVTFTPNGKKVVVANEGEPSDDYTLDPEGSISIITVGDGTQPSVKEAGFTAFNSQEAELKAKGVRIFGPNASVAQDLEPEYVAVSADSKTAYVCLQENNAVAVVDLRRGIVRSVAALGFKDHSIPGNGIDASNRDDAINIQNWPTLGMYQPDSIATYKFLGWTFVITANEGDARDYDGFSEEERVEDLTLDPAAYPNAATLQSEENLGRLKTTSATGDTDGDGDFDQIYSYGARSFSIWSISRRGNATQIYDSGDDFEQITASELPLDFNSTDDENDSFDNRSDDKGPEPEALTIGHDLFQSYSLVGLERVGGIMLYEITNPFSPRFIEYKNNRDFAGDAEAGTAGDLAPEGIVFVSRSKSPFTEPVVVVSNEVSGTTTLYRVKRTGGIFSAWLND